MSKGKLDKLSDLRHLLSASSNIIVSNLVQVALLILAIQRFALAVNDGVLGNDAVVRGIELNHLELYLPHAAADCEKVTHPYWAVGLEEVWLEVDIEQGSGEALNGVGNGEHSNALGLQRGVSYATERDTLTRTYLMSGHGWTVITSPLKNAL